MIPAVFSPGYAIQEGHPIGNPRLFQFVALFQDIGILLAKLRRSNLTSRMDSYWLEMDVTLQMRIGVTQDLVVVESEGRDAGKGEPPGRNIIDPPNHRKNISLQRNHPYIRRYGHHTFV